MKIGPQLETEKKFMDDISKYAHSPVHLAVARRDYASLKRIVASLPRLPIAGEVTTEEESLAAEQKAESVSKTIDRRDVPGRETPLHLAVRLGDALAVEILMAAGSDWSLQNEQGWSALQEAVCTREDAIAMIIARHYQPLAWAKWCRRLPRIVSTVAQIRDFYMEISFHFESSVIPFIGRIAPSDTYRIWKRGSNLRADMTLAGFDGFRIQRSDQSFLFLGEGTDDGKLGRGSLIVLAHKEKEITNALEGAGSKPTEAEVAHEVALMSQTNMYRPGIDVTLAELVPHLNWRRQDRTEMVGGWKAKVYDMLHVMVSVKSRRVPGAMTDEELFAAEDERINEGEHDGVDYEDILTAEERLQLDSALRMENSSGLGEDEGCGGFGGAECQGNGVGSVSHLGSYENCEPNGVKEKKSWFGWNKKGSKSVNDEKGSCWDNGSGVEDNTRILKKFSKLAPESSGQKSADHRLSSESTREEWGEVKKGKEKVSKKKKKSVAGGDSKHESEYKKGLRPVLWLTQDFPLKTEELLPLLDILANKVKAVRRLRELLTTKLPQGTFPVKVAIPIVPTIRVLVTFTKFKELQPLEEFSTPLSSPAHFQDSRAKEAEASTSWISWMRGSHVQSSESDSRSWQDDPDPFHIPSDYSWVDANEKKRRMRAKRAKSKKGKKQGAKHTEGQQQQQLNDDLEE